MSSVTPAALYQALRASGDSPLVAAAAVAIAGRESGYNLNANSGYRPSTGDYFSTGLFQINLGSKWGPGGPYSGTQDIHGQQLVNAGLTNPYADLQTLAGSVAAFNLLYKADGLSPWRTSAGSWADGTNLSNAAAASGGEVSAAQLQSFAGNPGAAGEAATGGAGASSSSTTPDATLLSSKGCPEGNLVTFPGLIPNISRCEGRALLGAASLAGGALIMVLGAIAMSKTATGAIATVGAAAV